MTVQENRTTRQGTQCCSCVPDVACACAGFIECHAIGDLVTLLNRAATQSGLAPQDLLENIGDEALAALYLSCAVDVRARAATALRNVPGAR
ncbi:hypothetical protein OG762_33960 [Streptomyces sp. NBC_01136]|uniref:hypothetical protein n=1 Tax=unclassified Streptomyces TaxID=2593676 RepID=UPI00324E66E4|nr:hypothetical protein OG762_33960 [Streptomyces sp. NBC_01136]